MADAELKAKITTEADLGGVDKAENALGKFGGTLNRISEIAAGVGLERLAEKFVDLGQKISSFAVKTGADFEQWKVAFDTMLGDSAKSSKLLSQISDAAAKTPFELPQLIEGSKRLLAYNIDAQQIIPTLNTLGNISAGVGTEKLPQLILAFGQVKAATKLTGAELRQFSEAGVPLLQALVDQANKAGGHWETLGAKAKKTKVDVGELNDHLAIAKKRLEEASKAGKTKESTLMGLKDKVQDYEQKLAKTNDTLGKTGKVWVNTKVTMADMQQMISDGKVKFDDVQKALDGMTQKGQRFYNMMDAQSGTFNGIMSNIHDQFTRVALSVMGFDMVTGSATFGQIISGSIFDKLRIAVQGVLTFLNDHQQAITDFFNKAYTSAIAAFEGIKTTAGTVITVLGQLTDFWNQHKLVIESVAFGISVALIPVFIRLGVEAGITAATLITQYVVSLATGVSNMITFVAQSYLMVGAFVAKTAQVIAATVATIAHTVAMTAAKVATAVWTAAQWLLNAALNANPIGLVIIAVAALTAGIIYAYNHSETFRNIVNNLWEKLKEVGKWLSDVFGPIIKAIGDGFNAMADAASKAFGAANKAKGAGGGGGAGGAAANGVTNWRGGPILVGEEGPEIVTLPRGSNVIPNDESQRIMGAGKTVTIYQNNQIFSDLDLEQKLRDMAFAFAAA